MNNEQSEKSIKCNLFIDHQLSWAGDGYFCENCRVRFEPVPNERSEELPCYCAEINSRNCPRHQNSEESAVQAERTRIIKALEGLRAEIIEKIIGDYDEALSLEEIGYLTKDRVKQLKDKWL